MALRIFGGSIEQCSWSCVGCDEGEKFLRSFGRLAVGLIIRTGSMGHSGQSFPCSRVKSQDRAESPKHSNGLQVSAHSTAWKPDVEAQIEGLFGVYYCPCQPDGVGGLILDCFLGLNEAHSCWILHQEYVRK